MIFHKSEKPSWDLRTTRQHTPGPLEKHRSFASEGFIWLVERSNTGAEEICRPNLTHGIVACAHFRDIFELFIDRYIICTYFSYIEYVLRIHLVKISSIFIKYEPSMEQSKGLAHGRFFFDPYVVKNHYFSWIWKTLLGPEKPSKTHTWTSGKTPVLRELRFIWLVER